MDIFDYAYIPTGVNRKDPLLSPIYASRSKLPPNIFFIGAEYDMLSHEEEVAARMYAEAEGAKVPESGQLNHWTAGGIKWKKVLDAQHGFDLIRKSGEWEEKRLKITRETYKEAASWLREMYK